MTKEQLFEQIRHVLVDRFEVEEALITMGANLYEDLEIDSIDAVDLLVCLKEVTGKKIPPERFKEVRTIENVVDTILAS